MAYPLPEVPFILDTDASNLVVGAVLSQIQEGEEKVIAYFSRTLNKPEKQYCVTRKELLAIIKAVKHFHHYLYVRSFVIHTDHSALRWLLNFREPEGQIARWIQKLQEYTFSIQHRAGSTHNNADSLSRRPCLKDMCHHCECLETKQETIEMNGHHAAEAATRPVQVPGCRQVIQDTFETIHSMEEWQQAQRADTDIHAVVARIP